MMWIMSLKGQAGSWADYTLPVDAASPIKLDELRRSGCNFQPGDVVLIYATAPQKALIGQVEVERVARVPVERLKTPAAYVRHRVGFGAIDRYAGVCLSLTVISWVKGSARRFAHPVSLAELRGAGLKQPPQMWCKVPDRVAALIDSAKAVAA